MMTDKKTVAGVLRELSVMKEMEGENSFKVRAFENAARVLNADSRDLKTLIEEQALEKLKGIGKGHISRIIHELYESGKSAEHEALKKKFPATLLELTRVPGLGSKRVKILYEKLEIKTLGELEYACKENRLASLEGFGKKTQEAVLRNIGHLKKFQGHFLINFASDESQGVVAYLKRQRGVERLSVAGSLRRRKEIIRDIDILASAKDPSALHDSFIKYPGTQAVMAHGASKSSILLQSGMQCDLRTVKKKEFAPALFYFTGSKEHNVKVRGIAKRKGIKINEYGLFKGAKRIDCGWEEDIFEALGLHYIPPELREDTGEVELAADQAFPRLVEEKDIRGVFHVHSTYSDGKASLEDMVAEAEKRGWEYIGISDHSQSARYAGGLEPARLKRQFKEIDRLQEKFKIRILKGIESDILADGSLDYTEDILREFDFVIGSIHIRHQMDEEAMTARVMKAMENRYLTFLGHPTGRLLLGREGYKIDFERIFKAAVQYGVVMEINANPHRLDLDWRVCSAAREKGILFSINPDAHSLEGLGDVTYGVGVARKARLRKRDIINTKSLAGIERFLKARRR